MEGQGVRDTLRQMRPDRFEDLIAAVALYRPGPMASIPEYCRRKHGERMGGPASRYSRHSGRDLRHHGLPGTGHADRPEPWRATRSARRICCAARWARRSPPRWKRSATSSPKARSSAAFEPAKAKEVFDLMAKFADYGFNKSHAAAYGLLAYQTAWLKANHPEVFIAACMSSGDQQHRPARRAEAGGGIWRHHHPAAGYQPLRRRISRWSGMDDGRLAIRYALAGVKRVGHCRHAGGGRGAGRHAVRRSRGFR